MLVVPGQESRFLPSGELSSSFAVVERSMNVAGRDNTPEEKHFASTRGGATGEPPSSVCTWSEFLFLKAERKNGHRSASAIYT